MFGADGALVGGVRGADRGDIGWAMSYGNQEWDAVRTMGIVLASHTTPVEARPSYPSVSTGTTFRTRMYDWARKNADVFSSPRSRSAAPRRGRSPATNPA